MGATKIGYDIIIHPPLNGPTAVELTLANTQEQRDICPGEWDDTRNRTDGRVFGLAGCAAGTGTVEIRDAADDSLIRVYNFAVKE